MISQELTLELEGCGEFTFELEYSYSSTPAQLNGPMEDCYPAEEESEYLLPHDIKKQLMKWAEETLLPDWLAEIDRYCTVLECDGKFREWKQDYLDSFDCDRS